MSTDVRRRAVIRLTHSEIARYLDLPDGLRITGILPDPLRLDILVVVEGDGLEPVASGCEPPVIDRPSPGFFGRESEREDA